MIAFILPPMEERDAALAADAAAAAEALCAVLAMIAP
jgi:hypothetical protein